ncbi:toll/interleukin-1 receptor domain-containing protein [Micrococcus flavus]|nr:toll/interleukin-1 receptor domain-containing protein [Micrococcus flavus]
MAQCTAPVEGHRTASGAANCPACRGGRSYYSTPSYYSPPAARPSDGGTSNSGGGSSGRGATTSRRTRSGASVVYMPSEERTFAPVARQAEQIARSYPDRRDIFLCHAWDDRQEAALELHDLLRTYGATVWFSEYDVGLGKSLLTEIDKGLRSSRVGIVLVTPSMLTTLDRATGIASKELAALLATDRVIPLAHGTDFDALREVSPLLGARSGLTTGDALSLEEAAKKIAAATAAQEND